MTDETRPGGDDPSTHPVDPADDVADEVSQAEDGASSASRSVDQRATIGMGATRRCSVTR